MAILFAGLIFMIFQWIKTDIIEQLSLFTNFTSTRTITYIALFGHCANALVVIDIITQPAQLTQPVMSKITRPPPPGACSSLASAQWPAKSIAA